MAKYAIQWKLNFMKCVFITLMIFAANLLAEDYVIYPAARIVFDVSRESVAGLELEAKSDTLRVAAYSFDERKEAIFKSTTSIGACYEGAKKDKMGSLSRGRENGAWPKTKLAKIYL